MIEWRKTQEDNEGVVGGVESVITRGIDRQTDEARANNGRTRKQTSKE